MTRFDNSVEQLTPAEVPPGIGTWARSAGRRIVIRRGRSAKWQRLVAASPVRFITLVSSLCDAPGWWQPRVPGGGTISSTRETLNEAKTPPLLRGYIDRGDRSRRIGQNDQVSRVPPRQHPFPSSLPVYDRSGNHGPGKQWRASCVTTALPRIEPRSDQLREHRLHDCLLRGLGSKVKVRMFDWAFFSLLYVSFLLLFFSFPFSRFFPPFLTGGDECGARERERNEACYC